MNPAPLLIMAWAAGASAVALSGTMVCTRKKSFVVPNFSESMLRASAPSMVWFTFPLPCTVVVPPTMAFIST